MKATSLERLKTSALPHSKKDETKDVINIEKKKFYNILIEFL